MKRVGKDVSAADYWRERNTSYASKIDGPYHANRLSVIRRLMPERPEAPAVLDFGCGEGIMLEEFAERASALVGIDLDPDLLRLAGERLERRSVTADLRLGGVEALGELQADAFNLVIALNVAAYFSDEEEERFYRTVHALLRPGGHLVITHSNELFDLYTANAFTVDFFARHFADAQAVPALHGLWTNPDVPRRTTFNVRENPLNYRYKLERYGFEEAQQEFANFHPLPPLLMDPAGFADIDARTYADTLDWPAEQRWKLLFQCSMFGVRAVRR